MKLILKIIKYTGISIALLAVFIFISLQTRLVRNILKDFIEAQANANINGAVEINEIRGSIVAGLTLYGVALNTSGGGLLYVKRLRVSYFLPALLKKAILINEITIDSPVITLSKGNDGRWNYEKIFSVKKKQGAKSGGLQLGIDSIHLRDGSIEVSENGNKSVAADKIMFSSSFDSGTRKGKKYLQLTIKNASLSVKKTTDIASIKGKVSLDGNNASINNFTIQTATSSIFIDGTVKNLAHPFIDISVAIPRLSFSDISPAAGDGNISSDIKIKGYPEELTVTQNLHYKEGSLQTGATVNVYVPEISFTGAVRDIEKVSFDISGNASGKDIKTLNANVEAAILPSVISGSSILRGKIRASFERQRLNLKELFLETPSGSVRASAKGRFKNKKINIENAVIAAAGTELFLEGSLSQNTGGAWNVELSSIAVALGSAQWKNKAPLRARLENRKADIMPFTLYNGGQLLYASGKIGSDDMLIMIKGSNFGLDFLPVATAEVVRASGTVSMDITISGKPGAPSIRGMIFAGASELVLLQTGVAYRDIRVHAAIENGELTINECTLLSGGGRANIKGKAVFLGTKLQSADIESRFNNFKLMETEYFTGSIDGAASLRMLDGANYISGKLSVLQSGINVPTGSETYTSDVVIVSSATMPGAQGASAKPDKPSSATIIDITIDLPGNSWVMVGTSEAEIEGKLRVRKERKGALSLSGQVRSVRGTIKIGERKMRITEGNIEFTGTNPADAIIYVIASGKIKDANINIFLSGTIKKPEINFSSEPPMDESDIISYIVFGKPSSVLSKSEGNTLEGTALDIIGNVALKGIKQALGAELTPEVIEIQPSGGSIGVGKYITDKLFVEYQWNPAIDDKPQTDIDYRLNEYFSFHSQTGNPKTSGADIFWKFSY